MLIVEDLRCEYLKEPIGIDITKPRLSWKLKTNKKAVVQTAYQIQITKDENFSTIIFESAKVDSDNSHLVTCNVTLEAKTRYFYRVKVWTNVGETDFSAMNFFETGLMRDDAFTAEFIAPPLELNGKPCPNMTYTFNVKKEVKQARIYATALGVYEIYLNGVRVGDRYFAPGWTSYEKRLEYQTYDVTEILSHGDQTFNIYIGNGWYKGRLGWEGNREIYGDRLALALECHVTYKDGTTEIIQTNKDWHVKRSKILASELYDGETIDARVKDENLFPVTVIERPKAILSSQMHEPVRKQETLPAVSWINSSDKFVIDFGQNLIGWVEFDIEGKSGQTVKLRHAEELDKDGKFYTKNLRTAKQENTYILQGNKLETFHPYFSFQGFRYVELTGFTKEQLKLENFRAVVLHSDFPFTGKFRSSDPLINQLNHNIKWSLKGNLLDVPTDCPQRDERLGWTGDAQVIIQTASFIADVKPIFTKWLKDLRVEQREDGAVPYVVPNIVEGQPDPENGDIIHEPFGSAAWGDAAVICPWVLYLTYGDKEILENQYTSMKDWIKYIEKQGDNRFLWNTGFHFGDWLALDSAPDTYIGATNRSLIATAFFYYSTSIVEKSACILNMKEDASYFHRLREGIKQAFITSFIDEKKGLIHATQTGALLALNFELVDGKIKDKIKCQLQDLLRESDHHLQTGFVGTPYLNHVLTEHGMNKSSYELMFKEDYPSWLYQVKNGATTIWEHWDGIREDGTFWSEDMNSFNHYAYGAIGDWLYRKVAGINHVEENPGYKDILIKPYLGQQLDWAEACFESNYGQVRTYWKKNDDERMLEVTIPANTKATVVLIDADAEKVKLSLLDEIGINTIKQVEQDVHIRLMSGDYSFIY